ncbi:hypothetical protein [Bradyrhizobium erythrophlei]|nr:hypothetical protein [Bradyrhizobium erythrophlei]
MFLRALFIGILIVVTARVASPQNESFWSAYETPGDLIRMALGLSVCLWLAVHVFILPKDQRHSVPGSISVSLFCRWRCYAPSSFGSAYLLFIYFFPSRARRSAPAFFGDKAGSLTPTLQSTPADHPTLARRPESSHDWPRLDRQLTEYAICLIYGQWWQSGREPMPPISVHNPRDNFAPTE